MKSADRLAMKAYPPKIVFAGEKHLEYDANEMNRIAYAEGVERAFQEILAVVRMMKIPFKHASDDAPFDEGLAGVVRGISRCEAMIEEEML